MNSYRFNWWNESIHVEHHEDVKPVNKYSAPMLAVVNGEFVVVTSK